MMKKLTPAVLLATAVVFCGASLFAQADAKKKQKAPPIPGAGTGGNTQHDTTGAVIDGNRVTVVYGRPTMKHPRTGEERKIWGGLVPWGQVWRTGADEATLLITQRPIEIAGKTIPAGAHTLWTLPNEDGTAKLIINKQIGQWGLDRANPKSVYDESNDVARVDLKKTSLDTPVDKFTMAVERNPDGGGVIKMMWADTQYFVPFTVKK
jgi:hypothetical protein